MKRQKSNPVDESLYLNNRTYQQYVERLTSLSISMFEWLNLPDTVDARFLELALFTDGQAIFFEDEVLGKLALQCIINGPLNVYRIPTRRKAFAVNGYSRMLDESNSVIIYNNLIRTNSVLDVEMFARKLYDLDASIIVNAKAQKTPVLVQCDEAQKLTLKNLYMQYDGNAPFIFGYKGLDPNSLKVLQTGAPYVGDKLYELKSQYWNEALTYLGISNTNVTKKERMISDEVIRNMGGTIASRYSRLEARKQACEQINKMFGLNIDVQYRADYREADDFNMYDEATGDGVTPISQSEE